MSRRNPTAEKVAKNSAAIKNLLKLEPNKLCADCKRNKHPRWASWNLGIFICIRCSGIHRGMGTHISRVKSVDLDSWTDEQLASIVSWGNARAKRYWEAKLPQDHIPSESKIENFIRTKYELKRWVMEGPMPDPADLGGDEEEDDDDDVPLAMVKDKQLERTASLGKASSPREQAKQARQASLAQPVASADLIGGTVELIPTRPSSGPPTHRVAPKADAAPPKTTTTTASKDSLLGLDFFQPAAPPRPASTTGNAAGAGGPSRPDLKQSILSLYASAPRQQQQQQPAQPTQPTPGSSMFGNMPSPTRPQGAFGGLSDAFGSLNFSAQPPRPSQPVDPFASLASAAASPKSATHPTNTSPFGALGMGGFFDAKPALTASQPAHHKQASGGGGGGAMADFGAFASPSQPAAKLAPTGGAALGSLLGLSFPASTSSPTTPNKPAPAQSSNDLFRLSSAAATSTRPKPPSPLVPSSSWNNPGTDIWGGSNAWDPSNVARGGSSGNKTAAVAEAEALSVNNGFGWTGAPSASLSNASATENSNAGGGSSAARAVAADEEFGGWTSSSTAGTGTEAAKPVSTFGANDDLFANVWQ